jgi:hypothetical protein
VTEQEADPDNGQDIQRQFALLQAEMQRVMAAPAPDRAAPAPTPASAAADSEEALNFQRIERGIEELRRDTDRLRARMTPTSEDTATSAAIAALGSRIADTDKRAEVAALNLARAVQETRQAIEAIEERLDALARRRPAAWPLPLTILLGALVIAAAVVLTAPGQMPGPIKALIDRVEGVAAPAQPHAMNAVPPPPPAPAPEKTAEAPPPPAPAPAAPVPAPVPAAPVAVAPVAVAPVVVAPVVVAQDPPAAAEADAAPLAVATPPAPPVATPAPPPVVTPVVTPAPAAAHERIVLRARGDVWVEVRNRQGGALIARTLHDGESWTAPDQPGLVLATGNAGGLDLLVDGVASPPLGGVGMVRRDVPLDPDLLRAGRYAADTTTRAKPPGTNK